LHVHQDAAASNAVFQITNREATGSNAGDGFLTVVDTTCNVTFNNQEFAAVRIMTNGLERFRVSSNGNIGVGASNPVNLLHVHQDAASSNAVFQITNREATGSNAGDGFLTVVDTACNVTFNNQEFAAVRIMTNGLERFRVSSNGNIGIGASNPINLCHIHQDVSASNTVLQITNAGTGSNASDGSLVTVDTTCNLSIFNQELGTVRFGTNNTERMRITSNGRVGIGLTNPSYDVDIVGNVNVSGNFLITGNVVTPTGAVTLFMGAVSPGGWLICDGSAISRTTFSALFAVIGTQYGNGDGSTTFNLPDLRSRMPAGYNSGDTNFNLLGKTGGQMTVALSTTHIPSHNHPITISDPGHNHSINNPAHSHSITDSGHSHGATVGSHTHTVTDPGHSHGVNDPGHGHSVNNASHSHGVNDPGHSHTYTFKTDAFQRAAVASGLTYWTGEQAVNTSSSGTGISIQAASTNVSINNSGTGISINNANTGITVGSSTATTTINSATTGISINSATTSISANSTTTGITATSGSIGSGTAFSVVSPYISINFIIKT
jgi:microcystin-dependent protein